MFCPNCGKSNPDDSKFCESCGTVLSDQAATPAQPAYAAPVPPAQPAYTPPAPAYAPPPQAQYYPQGNGADPLTKPLGVGGFIGTMIVLAIPIVGLIMIFVWGFGQNTNINRKNYCRAALILAIIGIVLSIVITITSGALLSELLSQYEITFN